MFHIDFGNKTFPFLPRWNVPPLQLLIWPGNIVYSRAIPYTFIYVWPSQDSFPISARLIYFGVVSTCSTILYIGSQRKQPSRNEMDSGLNIVATVDRTRGCWKNLLKQYSCLFPLGDVLSRWVWMYCAENYILCELRPRSFKFMLALVPAWESKMLHLQCYAYHHNECQYIGNRDENSSHNAFV